MSTIYTYLNPDAIQDNSIEGNKIKDGTISSSKVDSTIATTELLNNKVNSAVLTSGTNNGTLKFTVNGVTNDNIKVTGLGSAAYANTSTFATAAQGTLATNAMPKSGGTFTGDITLNADPTTNLGAATKQYVDNQITSKLQVSDAMVFKGTLGTDGTITALPTIGVIKGDTYKVITNGTYAGYPCVIGDLLIALNSGDIAATSDNWAYVPSGDEEITIPDIITSIGGGVSTNSNIYSALAVDTKFIAKTDIVYTALKKLVDTSKLVPGSFYFLTDYKTTSALSTLSIVDEQFCLLLQAVSSNQLSPIAIPYASYSTTELTASKLKGMICYYDINNDITKYNWADETNGRGVIYRMIDSRGNDIPYDYMHITFPHPINPETYTGNYFTLGGTADLSHDTTIYNNVIKPYYVTGVQYINRISIGDVESYNNFFDYNCYACYIEGSDNTLGQSCNFIDFVGSSNTIGQGCTEISLISASYITIGARCMSITSTGTITGCTIMNDCSDLELGKFYSNITFETGCQCIVFGKSATTSLLDSTERDYVKNIRIGTGCSYLNIFSTINAPGVYMSNLDILPGTSGSSLTNMLTVEIATLENTFTRTIAKNTSGTVKVFNIADLVG